MPFGAALDRTGRETRALQGFGHTRGPSARPYLACLARLSQSSSQLIGRAIPGVYNKVMNFRSIDPRDTRTGLPGSSDTDKRVWSEFFDPAENQLREADLEREFNRLWMSTAGHSEPALDAEAAQERAEAAASRLEGQELDDLLARYHAGLGVRQARPRASSSTTRLYERDPLVIAIARKRAGHR